ncbi:glycoside hydrolase family 18 protein (macronuclear) [Tetrahymena thermophila SB210]|uniref:Glycoside hydrolase family 18 protein n=1 Tax=Tetrahymena thermophila (strain SB210) TaxID=312017 RepID=W7XE94_TETTS|nr:glycoside hydrolase family 18 protein [Tetrahymena thermophila SB210]EWS75987.1 glycoside hydrolase family 18 protein [Tetrahymena thermophila SB210]|eukprot:XP_012651505.1 glycoside hydrolase family 18 protein [Tetrahymena thermophila SB210]
MLSKTAIFLAIGVTLLVGVSLFAGQSVLESQRFQKKHNDHHRHHHKSHHTHQGEDYLKYRMKSTGIPTTLFGPYVFIYDGIYEQNPNPLQAGIPKWVRNNGSNIAILSFLDPVELEKSDVPPQRFLDSLAEAKDSSILNIMFSIGGWDFQNRFVQTNPQTVAKNAASIAKKYNVGIELDCESDGAMSWMNQFISAYRAIIPNDGVNWYSVLTMDTGASPGAFPNVEQVALNNLNNLNWVNVMVNASDDPSDNNMYWSQHKFPGNQMTVARNLVNVCDSASAMAPTLQFKKDGQPIKGILFWAALSDETCDAAAPQARNCGTTCTDCTGGVGGPGNWSCPAVTSACQAYGVCK